MIMLVAVIGLFSLFSIWSINRAWLAGNAETAELQQLSRASLDAQVAFKMQVQEWKNVLLRGDDPALLSKYLGSFREKASATQRDLDRVAREAGLMALADQAATAIRLTQSQQQLTELYEAALAEKLQGAATLSVAAAHDIDKALRGIDRDLEAGINQIANDIAGLSEMRRSSLSARMQDRYLSLRWFVIGVILLSLVIMAFVVSRTLRATRA